LYDAGELLQRDLFYRDGERRQPYVYENGSEYIGNNEEKYSVYGSEFIGNNNNKDNRMIIEEEEEKDNQNDKKVNQNDKLKMNENMIEKFTEDIKEKEKEKKIKSEFDEIFGDESSDDDIFGSDDKIYEGGGPD
jgi:hypothetical protein